MQNRIDTELERLSYHHNFDWEKVAESLEVFTKYLYSTYPLQFKKNDDRDEKLEIPFMSQKQCRERFSLLDFKQYQSSKKTPVKTYSEEEFENMKKSSIEQNELIKLQMGKEIDSLKSKIKKVETKYQKQNDNRNIVEQSLISTKKKVDEKEKVIDNLNNEIEKLKKDCDSYEGQLNKIKNKMENEEIDKWSDPADPKPSNFNIFSHSLKKDFEGEYKKVRNKLQKIGFGDGSLVKDEEILRKKRGLFLVPETTGEGEEEENEGEEEEGEFFVTSNLKPITPFEKEFVEKQLIEKQE